MTHYFKTTFLVIGAGISGLLIARILHDVGRSVRVLEKGRGFGGRMATRSIDNARFDHGAQYFTVRDPEFQTWVGRWKAAGIARKWFNKLPGDPKADGHPRYIGARGISDIAKGLSEGIQVFRETQAKELRWNDPGWTVRTDSGSVFPTDQLIITAPVPQALELLDRCGVPLPDEDIETLKTVRYEKALAVMAHLNGPSAIPSFGGMKVKESPLTWLADNQRKGISDVPAVTLHSDSAFAKTHWDSPDEVHGNLLIESAKPYLGAQVTKFTCHRWGYARPKQTYGSPFFHHSPSDLLLAGDGFGGPLVEGAALSAIKAAGVLLHHHRKEGTDPIPRPRPRGRKTHP